MDDKDYFTYKNTDINKETVDAKPTEMEGFWGFAIGLGYMGLFGIIPFELICFFIKITTSYELNIYNCISQIIGAIFAIILWIKISKNKVGLLKKNFKFYYFIRGILYVIILFAVGILLSYIDSALFGEIETNANQSALNQLFESAPLLGLFFTVICAPILEEFTFRFYVFGAISKKNKILGYIASAALFGFVHMSATFSNFLINNDVSEVLNDLRTLPDYIASGLIFTYIYDKSKSIWGSIIAHGMYNLVAVSINLVIIFLSPCRITSITTADDSISFVLVSNSKTNTTIDSVRLVQYNVDGEEYNSITDYEVVDGDTIKFDKLVYGEKYTIEVKYTSDTLDESNNTIRESKEISAYAYTIQK